MSIVIEREETKSVDKDSRQEESLLQNYLNLEYKLSPHDMSIPCFYERIHNDRLDNAWNKLRYRDEIIDIHDQIDYLIFDKENESHFTEIEKKLKTLHILDVQRSKEKRKKAYSSLRFIITSLENILRLLRRQLEHYFVKDDWSELWDFEDELVNRLTGLTYDVMSLKSLSIDDDKELEKISMRTCILKYLSNYSTPISSNFEQNDNKDANDNFRCLLNSAYKNQALTKEYLHLFYLGAYMHDKSEYQNAMLRNNIERTDIDNDIQTDSQEAIYRFLLRDFQGDLSLIVKKRRKEKKMTQQQLADKIGVERTMITKVEKLNAITSLETTVKLLASLDLKLLICPLNSPELQLDTTQASISFTNTHKKTE